MAEEMAQQHAHLGIDGLQTDTEATATFLTLLFAASCN